MLALSLVFGMILMYFVLRPKLKASKEQDKKTEEHNKKLQEEEQNLKQRLDYLKNEELISNHTINDLRIQIEGLKVKEEEVKKHCDVMQDRINKDTDLIYQKTFDLMQEKLSQAADAESIRLQQAREEAVEEYLRALEDMAMTAAEAITEKNREAEELQKKLDILRAKADAAIAAAKREEEKLLEIDKYKILVTDLDLLEINRLREIAPYFRNARAIYKIIWESYYRNNTTDLINRVIGTGTHTGIYKLTNLKNQKVYIGQAANLADRWKDHIKAGLGIDTPNNMLYTAMMKDGVENFTFEVLEECERGSLNDREKYYIDFYRAQEHGYNMTRGGARN